MCKICRAVPCKPTCPNAQPPPIMGYCRQCGAELRFDYTYYTDLYNDMFCSHECADEYNKIIEHEWMEE